MTNIRKRSEILHFVQQHELVCDDCSCDLVWENLSKVQVYINSHRQDKTFCDVKESLS